MICFRCDVSKLHIPTFKIMDTKKIYLVNYGPLSFKLAIGY